MWSRADGSFAARFLFQGEDGIRGRNVTGVQTCALPIFPGGRRATCTQVLPGPGDDLAKDWRSDRSEHGETILTNSDMKLLLKQSEEIIGAADARFQIGRASCRERV